MHPETRYKLCKFRTRVRPCGRLFGKNFSYWGPIPLLLYRWGEIWHGGVDLHAKFDTHRCNVSPLRGKKPQNHPLSNLNTGTLHCTQLCQ